MRSSVVNGTPISLATSANVRSERGCRRPALSRYPSVRWPDASAVARASVSIPMAWRTVTTRAHDVLPCERASVIRLEDPKIGELPDALPAGARTFGQLTLRQTVGVHPDLVSGGV